jgi:hypothetical protein
MFDPAAIDWDYARGDGRNCLIRGFWSGVVVLARSRYLPTLRRYVGEMLDRYIGANPIAWLRFVPNCGEGLNL